MLCQTSTLFLVLILNGVTYGEHDNDDRPLVKLKIGKLKGTWLLSENGKKYAGFMTVPYAKPPIGELRFKPPEDVDEWMGEWDAGTDSPRCLSWDHLMAPYDTQNLKGFEDCLYISIYTPRIPDEKHGENFEVIVWFHPGGFMFGSSNEFGAKRIIDKNIILVTVNYRLGPLGFLSFDDNVLPGNNGLRDQTHALKWIQNHISKFGGNPHKVTIMGMSAGGASVHFHYLSPLSKGLFHGGVSISGTALSPWALAEDVKEKSLRLSHNLGCDSINTEKILDCLRQRPAHAIAAQVNQFQVWNYLPFSPFGPVVEKRNQKIAAFLPDTPLNLLRNGHFTPVNWVVGVTESEGLYPSGQFVTQPDLMKKFFEEFDYLAPFLFDYNRTVSAADKAIVNHELRKRLGHLDEGAPLRIIRLVSERLFLCDAQRSAELQSKFAPVWFYYFTYRGKFSLSDVLTKSFDNFGCCHGDDVSYFLNVTYLPDIQQRTGQEKLVQEQMLEYWSNFAKYGEPSSRIGGEWLAVQPGDDLEYLEISGSPARMSKTHDLGNIEFWESLPIKEPEQIHKNIQNKDEL